VKRSELSERLEEFYGALEEHQQLWRDSLDKVNPRFPRRNQTELKQQTKQLNRMLGALRPFLEKERESWVMHHAGSGVSWDALDTAAGDDVAIRKGDSIRMVLNRLDQIRGKWGSVDQDEEIQLTGDHQGPEQVVENEANNQVEQPTEEAPSSDKSRTVMVVHGRDDRLNKAMFAFLRSLDLHPVEWSEAVAATGDAAPYIGTILDAAFDKAQAVVVLLTGDDMAYLRKDLKRQNDEPFELKPTPQARPNVFFEAGRAMASHPNRTVFVEIGKLRPFSDIDGIHTVRLDNTSEKHQDVASRLKTAGCAVNMGGKDWHSAGDFTAPEVNEAHAETASPTVSEREKLSDDQKTVLVFLASAGDDGYTAQRVSTRLGLSLEKAKLHLGVLKKKNLVASFLHSNKPTRWHLTQSGREVLDDYGLL